MAENGGPSNSDRSGSCSSANTTEVVDGRIFGILSRHTCDDGKSRPVPYLSKSCPSSSRTRGRNGESAPAGSHSSSNRVAACEPSLPEHIDHLAIRSDDASPRVPCTPSRPFNRRVMNVRRVRQATDHGLRQHGVGVQQEHIADRLETRLDVDTLSPQLIHDACAMCGASAMTIAGQIYRRIPLPGTWRPACTRNRWLFCVGPHGNWPLVFGVLGWFTIILPFRICEPADRSRLSQHWLSPGEKAHRRFPVYRFRRAAR